MADANKTLRFLLVGEDRSASKTLRGVGNELDEQNKKWSNWERAGVAASAAVIAGLTVMAKKSIDAASELNESANAVNVTFGASADGIMKLGETAATSLGLSQSKFNSMAVQFSAFAEQIAGDGGDVVGVIDDLTKRGSDFASVMNLEVNDAMRIFQSGLAGETEPLRKYGIDLSAAAVGAYAVANGISASAASMSESEKVQARYNLLMEETAKVAGDFANTSTEAANAERILSAQWEDSQAQLGQKLLPVMKDLLSVGTAVVGWLGDNSDMVLVLSGVIGALAVAVITVEAAQRAWNATQAVTKAITGHNITGVGTFVTKLGLAGAALGVAGAAYLSWKNRQDEARRKVEELTETLDAQTGAVTDNTAAWVSSALADDRKVGLRTMSLKDAADKLGISMDLLTKAWLAQPEAVEEAQAAIEEYQRANGYASVEAQFLGNELGLQVERMGEAADAAREKAEIDEAAAEAQGALAGAHAETTEAVQEETKSIEDLLDAQRRAYGIAKDAAEAESDFQAAIDAASASLKENGRTLDLTTEAGRANQAALFALQEATFDNVDAQIAADASGKTLRETMQRGRDEFVKTAAAILGDVEAAEELADKYGLIPDDVSTVIQANATQAIREAEEALRAIGAIPDRKSVTISLGVQRGQLDALTRDFRSLGLMGAFATGGTAHRAGPYLVGEEGPEIVDLPAGARVYNAQDSARMRVGSTSGGPAGTTQRVTETINLVVDGKVLAKTVREFNRGLA